MNNKPFLEATDIQSYNNYKRAIASSADCQQNSTGEKMRTEFTSQGSATGVYGRPVSQRLLVNNNNTEYTAYFTIFNPRKYF